ncbi:MAG: OmpH family outer membrane protein [Aquabacterium sp.]|uniref:OmpH family outer membrane protein n=1 Tax=Aquabacterium sp. TaxID=1872578 RepID=UPI0025C18226|nr:OmpH family outer membrane protein [Aquabacterium sp.]MBI5925667.1 OmpH family outer membrane protein [Aquabacterium sp.]HEX5357879.1 OmpH family outer membrane protein [Aquabacterium sp.]
MKSIRKILLASITVLVSLAAHGQELKIGVVNLDRVLRDTTAAKAAQTKLEAEFKPREKELNKIEGVIKSASERFEKDAPTLGESERIRRQRDLLDQDRELQRKRREFQEDFNQRKNEELTSILDRANRVVKQIFEQEKFDLILQEAVFASNRVDITGKVIKALDTGSAK